MNIIKQIQSTVAFRGGKLLKLLFCMVLPCVCLVCAPYAMAKEPLVHALSGADSQNAKFMPDEELQLLKELPYANVDSFGLDHIPNAISGKLGSVNLKQGPNSWIHELKSQLKIFRADSSQLELTRKSTDAIGNCHFRFSQKYHGKIVHGAQIIIHTTKTGEVYCINGTARSDITLPEAPRSSLARARECLVRNHPKARIHTDDTDAAYILAPDKTVHMAYRIVISEIVDSQEYKKVVHVDENDGSEIFTEELTDFVINRKVYTASHGDPDTDPCFLLGSEAKPPTSEQTAVANFSNLGKVYGYYSSKFGRDSYDAQGAALVSYIHVGTKANQAGWQRDSERMLYGDGDGVTYGNFALPLDITGHELTHAVIQKEIYLNNSGEAGAIGEGLSDIFGTLIKINSEGINSFTWLFGRSVCINPGPTTALRRLDDPCQSLPDACADYYPLRNLDPTDNGSVHANSGICSYAFYLMVNGGSRHNQNLSIRVPALNPNNLLASCDMAANIFYAALCNSLTATTSFSELRAATINEASQIYGEQIASRVALGWDAVGVLGTTGDLRPVNLSSRGYVGTGETALVGGFSLSGSTSKNLLIRGIGPSLSMFGISNFVADPKLDLVANNSTIATNDDWGKAANYAEISAAASRLGAFSLPLSSKDACVYQGFGFTPYTAIMSASAGSGGMGLLEIYDGDLQNPTQIANLSTRAQISSSNTLNAGIVVKGSQSRAVLIRAVGPSLANYGVVNCLPDPVLTLAIDGIPIRTSDDWGQELNVSLFTTAFQSCGAFPLTQNSNDSVLLLYLPPGTYSASVSGKGTDSGVALLEVYILSIPL